jgi:hypothetical protein
VYFVTRVWLPKHSGLAIGASGLDSVELTQPEYVAHTGVYANFSCCPGVGEAELTIGHGYQIVTAANQADLWLHLAGVSLHVNDLAISKFADKCDIKIQHMDTDRSIWQAALAGLGINPIQSVQQGLNGFLNLLLGCHTSSTILQNHLVPLKVYLQAHRDSADAATILV